MPKNPHAVALGRKGGKATSEAKKAATRISLEKARKAKAEKRNATPAPVFGLRNGV